MSASAQYSERAIWMTAVFIVAALFIFGLFGGTLGQIGPDSDDVIRLIQVRDFMQGQSWFDVTQYRMGLEGGTAMHWSRLPDIPLIILIWFFDLFLPYSAAETAAFTLWPPMCFLIVFYGIIRALKCVGGQHTLTFGLVLLAFIFFKFFRFLPGAIDHHNLQMGLLALAVGFTIDPKFRIRSFVVSGMACAASIAIGTEVAVFIGIICAFFAVNWLVSGKKVKSGTIGFGLSLAISLGFIFFGTIAPEDYGKIYCDALSLIMLTAGALGGFGLAMAAYMLSEKPFVWRLSGLGLLGIACLALFLIQAPQCLSNPLNDLPPIVHTLWLDEVIEAQSVGDIRDQWVSEIPYMMGMQVTALLVTIWLLIKGEDRCIFGLYLALIISAFIFSLYQVRFYIFGFLFAIVPLAFWIGGFYTRRISNPETTRIGYIFALAISLPYTWSAGLVLANDVSNDTASIDCFSDTVIDGFAALPKGVVLAVPNGGADIIANTPHRAMNANYHRNSAGIQTSLEIFTTPAAEAQTLLQNHKVNYVHFCRTHPDSLNYKNYAPGGLMSDLLAERIPDFLVPLADYEDGNVTIYKVQ